VNVISFLEKRPTIKETCDIGRFDEKRPTIHNTKRPRKEILKRDLEKRPRKETWTKFLEIGRKKATFL